MINFKKPLNILRTELKKYQPYDLALVYPSLDDDERTILRKALDYKRVIKLFEELDDHYKLELYNELPTIDRKKKLLDNLSLDELREFIILFNDQNLVISLLKKPKQIEIRKILLYNDNLAGSIMNPEIFKIPNNIDVKEATTRVIQNSKDNDFIDDIFVVNSKDELIGFIALKDLIIARKDEKIDNILNDDIHFVYNNQAIFDAIKLVKDYDLKSLPVIDQNNHLVGVITADDILDEIYEEKVEDYQKLAQLSNYTKSSSAFKRSITRLPWLIIGIILALVISNIVLVFEKVIETIAALFIFQSLVLDTCGNIGTQSLAITILKINSNELTTRKDINKHIRKEFSVGLINAFLVGIYGFVIAFSFLNIPYILDGNMKLLEGIISSPAVFTVGLGMVVFISLFIAMLISSLLGVLIPIIAYKKNIDPANVSGPILTTINDIIGLVVYFATAYLFLIIV